jgi:NTP pyrophosphatase (non-canonical NTP hydrolase)
MEIREANERAVEIRAMYHQLEERLEGSRWETKDDVLGLVNDVGQLGRLVMAREGRWKPAGDVDEQLASKLSECLWWILVLADRLDVDIDAAFGSTMDRIGTHLRESIAADPG